VIWVPVLVVLTTAATWAGRAAGRRLARQAR